MKTKPLVKIHPDPPIYQRGTKFFLVKSFPGIGQKQIALNADNKKTAIAKAQRFLDTLEDGNTFETAQRELDGDKVIKKADDLDFESISKAFKEYCKSLEESSPREITIKGYLSSLKRIMGEEMLSKVDPAKYKAKFVGDSKDPAKLRSYAVEIRNAKSVFTENALKWYSTNNYTAKNPFKGMAKPKEIEIEQYTPLPETIRTTIWNDCDKQDPHTALIVLLGLALGLRRNEVEFSRTTWFSDQGDHVIVSIKEETDFIPKSGKKRTFRITKDLYNRLLNHRNKIIEEHKGTKTSLDNDEYLVPVYQRKGTGKRLWGRMKTVAKWLKSQGIKDRQAFHTLRKEAGSIHYMQTKNLLETSRYLGHSNTKVTEDVYAGIIDPAIIGGMDKKETPDELAAKLLGITLEQLMELKKNIK
jgi:integrase